MRVCAGEDVHSYTCIQSSWRRVWGKGTLIWCFLTQAAVGEHCLAFLYEQYKEWHLKAMPMADCWQATLQLHQIVLSCNLKGFSMLQNHVALTKVCVLVLNINTLNVILSPHYGVELHTIKRDMTYPNGYKGPHFVTVCSQRLLWSWFCDRNSVKKGKKRCKPCILLTSTFTKLVGFETPSEKFRGRGFWGRSTLWKPLLFEAYWHLCRGPVLDPIPYNLNHGPLPLPSLYEWLLQALSSCLICRSVAWLGSFW